MDIARPGLNRTVLFFGLAMLYSVSAYASDVDPFDYTIAPVGTNILVQYFGYNHSNKINIAGSGDQSGKFTVETTVSRYIHYTTIFGMPADFQFVLPAGHIHNASANGMHLDSNSGLGDPSIVGTLFVMNNKNSETIFGITPMITFPWGAYDKHKSVNFSAHQYQYDMQTGFQT